MKNKIVQHAIKRNIYQIQIVIFLKLLTLLVSKFE